MAFELSGHRLTPLFRQVAGLRPPTPRSGVPNRNLLAVACMLVTACIWALVPLGVDVAGGADNPFFFNAGWRIGGVIGCVFVLVVRFPTLLLSLITPRGAEVRDKIGASLSLGRRVGQGGRRNFGGWAVLYGVFGKFEYAFFAFAVGYASVSAVTIIFTVWPIVFILAMALLYRNVTDRYTHNGMWLGLMILLCFIGFAFVVWPEKVVAPGSGFYIGVGVAIFAALIAGSHNAITLRWADRLGDEIHQTNAYGYSHNLLDIFSAVFVLLITQLVCAVISIVIALMLGESINYTLLMLSIAGGFMASGIADVLFRTSNIITTNLGVNAVIYGMPIFAMMWLAIFSTVSLARVDYFVVGILIIIVSNLLVNSEAEIRKGFRGLILTLGVCGTFVYFREELFTFIGLVHWHWGVVQYFGVVGMAATVFTLLLAFRVGRLISRTDAEENRIFLVFRKLDFLAERGVINENIRRCVLEIDAPASNTDLSNAYFEARGYFRSADYSDGTNRQMLIEAQADLDALVRSRQSALVLGELFSLVIFGGITIFLVLFSRPQETGGWPRFMIDIFAMLIAPVIVFLMVNIWDLHRERNEKWLELRADLGDYAVHFPDAGRRRPDQWLSILLGVGIVGTYVGLLAHKWLGWFS